MEKLLVFAALLLLVFYYAAGAAAAEAIESTISEVCDCVCARFLGRILKYFRVYIFVVKYQ